MSKKKNTILDSVYQTARGLHDARLIDTATMREFESLCIEPVHTLSPTKIKAIRLREKVSQPVFAFYLNVSPSTIKKWETGEKSPSGAALRLLNIIELQGLDIIQNNH